MDYTMKGAVAVTFFGIAPMKVKPTRVAMKIVASIRSSQHRNRSGQHRKPDLFGDRRFEEGLTEDEIFEAIPGGNVLFSTNGEFTAEITRLVRGFWLIPEATYRYSRAGGGLVETIVSYVPGPLALEAIRSKAGVDTVSDLELRTAYAKEVTVIREGIRIRDVIESFPNVDGGQADPVPEVHPSVAPILNLFWRRREMLAKRIRDDVNSKLPNGGSGFAIIGQLREIIGSDTRPGEEPFKAPIEDIGSADDRANPDTFDPDPES